MLATGTRLGPYEIIAPLGSGGMGAVYRARDTRLERTVAIKVLAEGLATDPQFRERFGREARVISQLTHPHICTLHDVGDHDGTAFLVMEFLEGETLADRLARAESKGYVLPAAEALTIATQIADALSVAHRTGIVHRDLKPANVMLTKSGVKLLDFGLAKQASPAVMPGAISQMQTTPREGLTMRGTILGTFQYMAPEQVEGGDADARTDIFAFGCVLHELFTGKKAFDGKTAASLIAAILEREPPAISSMQPLAPPLLDGIVRKCLAKNRDDRWQSASDLGSALRWAGDRGTGAHGAANIGATSTPARRRRARLAAILAAAAVIFAAGMFALRYASVPATPAATVRFEIVPPPDVGLSPAPVASAAQLAVSPDGRRLVFVAASKHGASQLWVRMLAGVQSQPVAGTEGASFPFWSPDGRFVAFFAAGKLKKVDIVDGVPEVICNAPNGRGGAWSREGTIVFTGSANSPMSRVSAGGGAVQPASILNPASGASTHNWPQFLPDGRHFLFYQRGATDEHQGIYVGSLDSFETTRVLASTGAGLYASGHLLFVRGGMLFAQRFDARRLEVQGEPVRVADRVGHFTATLGYIAVSVSESGVLAFGPNVAVLTTLKWRGRDGTAQESSIAPAVYRSPRLSPDQKRVAVATWAPDTGTSDIWVLELALRNASRQTSDPLNDWFPAWSTDGKRIFFGSTRSGSTRIFRKAESEPDEFFAGSGVGGGDALYPNDLALDGRFLSYTASTSRGYDLGLVELSGAATPTPFLSSPSNEVQSRFAPNGRWLAYASDESGKYEVYVRPFPAASGQSLISIAGGMQPEWRRDGRELFYISPDRKLMAVPVTTDGPVFAAGVPRALFEVQIPEQAPPYPNDYAVATDGQRFLVNTVVEQPTRPALTVILNWTSELQR